MNLQQLRYVVEIEKTSSITGAAKNLFMGQPNLSKSVKELESEIGITLFNRTAKGVEPTSGGLQFLRYAKNILEQMDELESLYKPQAQSAVQFSMSVPRATYISVTFSRFLNNLDCENPLDIQYKETNSVSAVADVSTGNSSLGIIRYQDIYESYFLNLLHENNLQHEVLWEFPMCLLMSETHPLAALSDIPYHLLLQYTEISHGDFQVPALPPSQTKKLASINPSSNRIFVYDRGSQFDLLQRVAGTYLWVSPMPYEELAKHNLVQKPCSVAGINKDVIIYHNRDELQQHEKDFISTLRHVTQNELQIFTQYSRNAHK